MLRYLQLAFGFFSASASTEPLESKPVQGLSGLAERLRILGLTSVNKVLLVKTRRVMVSLTGDTLRIHEGFSNAPDEVLKAVVIFLQSRNREARKRARNMILSWPVELPPATIRRERDRPGDSAIVEKFMNAHRDLNDRYFESQLSAIQIRISSRMRTRLGHYSPAVYGLQPAEIVMSLRHVKRDGWSEALHTLLHEMVHQWQDENRLPLDHGPRFRKMALQVGIVPRARRAIGSAKAY